MEDSVASVCELSVTARTFIATCLEVPYMFTSTVRTHYTIRPSEIMVNLFSMKGNVDDRFPVLFVNGFHNFTSVSFRAVKLQKIFDIGKFIGGKILEKWGP